MDVQGFASARRRNNTLQAVESEIAQEKAGALGRAGMRLEEALEALKQSRDSLSDIERRLQQCENDGEEADLRKVRSKLVVDVNALRNRVELAHQFLIIQREAIGMRHHADVERCYRIAERL